MQRFSWNNDQETEPTPYEEDPFVHEMLDGLARFSPSPDFADRVMTHVWRPAPSWIRQVTHACHTAFSRKHVWKVIGGLAVTSAAAMIALVLAAMTYWVHVETAWSVAFAFALDVWQFGVARTVDIGVLAMRWTAPLAVSWKMLVAIALSSAMIVTLSGLGLRYTIGQYRNEKALLHARK